MFKDENYKQSSYLKATGKHLVHGLTSVITRNSNTSGLFIKHFSVFRAFRS